jgi:hypothetical protein
MGGLLPGYPSVLPVSDLWAMDAVAVGGRYVPNRLASGTASSNLFPLSSGQIAGVASGATVTENFANGPKGQLTAKRIQLAASGNYYQLFATPMTAGTYTVAVKLKNNAVGTSPAFQLCDFQATGSGSATTTVDDTGYATKTLTITANGSTQNWVMIRNSSGSATDLLLDEVQVYEGGSVPSYASEVLNDGSLRPTIGFANRLTMSGKAVDLSGGGVTACVRLAAYPLAQSNTEMTLVGVISTADASTLAAKVLSLGDSTGVFDIATSAGNAYGAPALPQTNSDGLFIPSRGYHVIAARFKASQQSMFFHEVEAAQRTSAMSAVSRSYLTALTDTNGSFPFKGKFTNLMVFNAWLSDADVYAAVRRARAVHIAHGETAVASGFNMLIPEGDSITAGGSTYWRQYLTAGQTNIYGATKAVTGSTMADVTSRLTLVTKNITEAKMNGNYPIVSLLIGANGIPTLNELQTYWTAIRNTGAKVVACTILPNAGQPAQWETDRQARNTDIRNSSSYYDALADFASDPTMGVVNSFTLTPGNWTDSTHPNAAGHALLKPYYQTAVNGIKV